MIRTTTQSRMLAAGTGALESDRTRRRPAIAGSSIGVAGGQAGTFGCLVRDNTDNSIQILTTAGVVTHGGTLPAGTPVYQPAPDSTANVVDLIGTLTRSTQLSTYPALYPPPSPAPSAVVDAAIIRPTDDELVSAATSIDPGVSTPHRLNQAVGLIVGAEVDDDGQFYYVAISMSTVLDALDVQPLTPGTFSDLASGDRVIFAGAGGKTPQKRPRIGTVLGGGEHAVRYAHPDGPSVAAVGPSFRVSSGIAEDDDIGAVLLRRSGNVVESRCAGCSLAPDLEAVYNIPFTQDVDLADAIRDDYLLGTLTGSMLVQVFYRNEHIFRDRLVNASPTEVELKYARLIYNKYSRIVRGEIDNVSMTYAPVTPEVLDDVRASVYGLSRFMTAEEHDACQSLLVLLESVEGFTMEQGIDYMNRNDTLQEVQGIISQVPGWDASFDPSSDRQR